MGRRAAGTLRAEVDSGTAELVPDPDRRGGWTLLVCGTPQSHVDLDDPTHLEFEYVRRLGHLVDLAAEPGRPLRVLHLGGGALTLARYVAATRPGSRQYAVELDAALVELVRRELPVPRPASVRVRVGDARAWLARTPPGSLDLIVLDAFAAARTPAHLTSVEFVRAGATALAPGGLYAANIGDGAPLAFTRAQVSTVLAVFARASLVACPAVFAGRRFGNLVLVAGDRELPVAGLAAAVAGDPFPARVRHGAALARFTGGAAPVTDATARPSPAPPPGFFGVA
ncbi:MAG TPA: fused MFS/spermidine synthase [Pseudonocardiaceae bacterium]